MARGNGALMFIQALQNAGQQVMQAQDRERQAQADALNQQLLKLRIDQQKMQLDTLKHEQEKEKIRMSYKDQFLSGLQTAGKAAAPSAPLGPEMQGPPAPPAQPDVAGNYRQMATLANQAGEMDLLNNLVAQGAVASPVGLQQQRAKDAALRSAEATAGIQEQSLADNEALKQTRATLSAQFAERAGTAKGIDAQRFKLAAEIAKTGNEAQLTGLMNELFPSLGEATTPFQALYRQTGSAKKALEIMSQIEIDQQKAIAAGKEPKNIKYGDIYETRALGEYGLPYADLSQSQKQDVNKYAEERKLREIKAQVGEGLLPTPAQTEVSTRLMLADYADDVVAKFRPEYVGKFNYAGNRLAIARGATGVEGLSDFVDTHNRLLEYFSRDQTGAAIQEFEKKNFKDIVGSTLNEPNIFINRVSSFSRDQRRMSATRMEVATIGAVELQERNKKARISQIKRDMKRIESVGLDKLTSDQKRLWLELKNDLDMLDTSTQSGEKSQPQREEKSGKKPLTSMSITNDDLYKLWPEAR